MSNQMTPAERPGFFVGKAQNDTLAMPILICLATVRHIQRT